MGTPVAPSYANLFLCAWEREIFSSDGLSMYLCQAMTWHRNIDNVFLIWDGPRDLLDEFLSRLNDNRFNLIFTYSYDDSEISYLYTKVFIDSTGHLSTSLYRKSTAGNSIIRADSAHTSSLKRSILFAQYLRLRRICSYDSDFVL